VADLIASFLGMVAEFFLAAVPESRWGRAVAGLLVVAGVAATAVIIYLAASGDL
jgi:hypothetical protein